MVKLSLSPDERKSKRRQYTRENRELWKSLGMRMMSAPVHDDDRELVLAELEVRRCLRLAAAAADLETSLAVLIQVGRRNLNPCPPPKDMTKFLEQNARKDNYTEIDGAISEAKKAHAVFRNSNANLNNTDDDRVRQRLFAKEVAFGNLAAAWWRLANVRANMGETTLNVFNMQKDHIDV